MLYIKASNYKGQDTVVIININGKVDPEFNIPLIINRVNDIVALKDAANEEKMKSTTLAENLPYLFALGNFKENAGNDVRFVIKLSVDGEPTTIDGENIAVDGFELYPVPARDKLIISFLQPQERASLDIYDLNGLKLLSTPVTTAHSEIDLSTLGAGIYVVKITTADGKVSARKILKH